jgi:hypothetical protein
VCVREELAGESVDFGIVNASSGTLKLRSCGAVDCLQIYTAAQPVQAPPKKEASRGSAEPSLRSRIKWQQSRGLAISTLTLFSIDAFHPAHQLPFVNDVLNRLQTSDNNPQTRNDIPWTTSHSSEPPSKGL